MTNRMDWVADFYTRFGEYVGTEAVAERHYNRAQVVERLLGDGPKSVLELGAGSGQTAFCLANAGHRVTAIELARGAALAEIATRITAGQITVVEGDFYKADFENRFDLVGYWDGFGVGSDADRRRLLRRIADDWLAANGVAIVDVFCPWYWARHAGQIQVLDRHEPCHRYRERRSWDFDPIRSCFLDTWCPIDDATGLPMEEMAITQTIRCYSPSEFVLLLEGTGLAVSRAEVAGQPFDMTSSALRDHPVWNAASYQVVLAA